MTNVIDYAMTREEVAEQLGISRSRVEQIEKNALKKIGRRMERFALTLQEKREMEEQRRATWDWGEKYDRLYRELGVKREADGNG